MTFNEIILLIMMICGFAAALIIGMIWGIRNFLRSKSGKVIDRAKAQKKPLVLAASSGHLAKLMKVNEVLPGLLETAPFKQRKKKQRYVFNTPKTMEVELTAEEIENETARSLTEDCVNVMLKANTEKVFLEDGVPVTLALADRVITTGVKGIGSLAYFEKLCKIEGIKDKITELSKIKKFKVIAEYLTGLAAQITIIRLDVIRAYFDADYSQEDSQHQHDFFFVQGYREAQNKEKATEKIFIYGGIAMGIVGCVMGAILAFMS